jgi:hypothetical protein
MVSILDLAERKQIRRVQTLICVGLCVALALSVLVVALGHWVWDHWL